MKKASHKASPQGADNSLRNMAFYAVATGSLFVGLAGYNAGATIEGALMRVVVTLLACTAVGYLVNIILMMVGSTAKPAATQTAAPEAGAPGLGGLNLTVGDENV